MRPDLLVLHGQWGGFLGALAGRMTGIRHVVYIARWPAFYADWDFWRINRNFICEWTPCRLSDKVVVLSESSRQQYLIRHWPAETKLMVIPNTLNPTSIPTSAAAAALRATEGWNDKDCHVVCVGRLASQKRVDWRLKSWAHVKNRCPNVRLWIVGGGKLRSSLEEEARSLELGDSCSFLGPRTNGIEFIAAADIVAFPSVFESFGRVALEGMACGKPIVASSVDGLRDLLSDGQTALLAPAGDIELFAEHLCRLIQDGSLRDRIGAAGKLNAARFCPNVVMPRYFALIEGLLRPELLDETPRFSQANSQPQEADS
jgi:glycosyltransferase involved in cell wall biosynthesis